MHNISHKDFSCLANMLESIKKIRIYSSNFENADSFYDNSLAFDACMMNFVVIGEMVDKLSDDYIVNTSSQMDWYKVKSLRNIVAHNYFGIDAEEVWQIINGSLVSLKQFLEKELY